MAVKLDISVLLEAVGAERYTEKLANNGVVTIEQCATLTEERLKEWDILSYSGIRGAIRKAKALLSSRDDVVQQELLNLALYNACERGDVPRVKELLSLGASVNYHNDAYHHQTPLHISSRNGHTPVVSLLLSQERVDVNIRDKYHQTPLHISSKHGHTPVVSLLLSQEGVDVNIRDKDGLTPLHCSAWYGHLDTCKFLFTAKAHVNVVNKDGNSPLHYAARNGHLQIVKLLIQNGASSTQCNNDGETALDKARRKNRTEVVAYLEELGEDHTHTNTATASDTGEDTENLSLDTDAAHEAFEQEVDLSVSNLVMSGSPGSGKTSSLHLSINEPPPNVRHSTGCVEKPVRAIAHGAICINGTKLQKLETKEMLDMVCETLKYELEATMRKNQAEAESEHEDHTTATPDSSTDTGQKQEGKPSDDSPHQDLPPPTDTSTFKQDPSPSKAPSSTRDKKTIQVFATLANKLSRVKASPDFLTARLVSTVDSGGQPHFMDAARLFLRNNSLYLLTLKLNERLDDKPKFDFFINGKPISMCDTALQLTNLQLVELLAKNVSSLQLSVPDTAEAESKSQQAKFMILGTFLDKADNCKDETVADKNRILRERLKDCEAERVDVGDDVIFAINAVTADPEERRKLALKLQEKILNTPGITIKTRCRLRWYGLLLHMLDEAEKRNVSILELDEVIAAGECLEMSERETMRAIKFFHDLNLLMHCPSSKLNHLVFVDVKPILDQVSALIGVSFIDRSILDDILPNLPANAQRLLKDYGRFSRIILDSFSFSAPFTPDVFLDLLEHLCMIARIEKSGQTLFFLPSTLPYAPDHVLLEKVHDLNPWILRLAIRRDTIPVDILIPKGYLPTLVVCLLNSPKFEADMDSCQYRNLMSICYGSPNKSGRVYLIEWNHQLEIYYSWEAAYSQHCCVIRSEAWKALSEVEQKLYFRPDVLIKQDVFVCSCNGPTPRHFCAYNSNLEIAVCEKSRKPYPLNSHQKQWMQQPQVEDKPAEEMKCSTGQDHCGKGIPLNVSTLNCLKYKSASGKVERLFIMDDMGSRWRNVGLGLSFKPPELDCIESSHPKEPVKCCEKLMSQWLDGFVNDRDSRPKTWPTLLEVMGDARLGELADKIEKIVQ